MPCTSVFRDSQKKDCVTLKPRFSRELLPNVIKSIIILHLPLWEILRLKRSYKNEDVIELGTLLYSPNHKHLIFQFTKKIGQVFSFSKFRQLGIRKKDYLKLCTQLYEIQTGAKTFGVITTINSGVEASTVDYDEQNINCTLDGNEATFWSSDGSEKQAKVDWLLYDLKEVAVISRISVAAFKAIFHVNAPTYGFKTCWIELGFERDQFHYKTREFVCANTDEVQHFTVKHFDNKLPAARYVKFWMRGCHQIQRIDDLWYYALKFFEVAALPVKSFPNLIPKIL